MSPQQPDTERSPLEDTMQWESSTGERDLSGKTLGDFQVERLLGRGGMGEVYLARQVSLSRPVALKVLRPDLLTKATYLSRFEAEATAVAKLNHPNIVHVYTLGSVDGIRFIAMEYVQGTNLRDYLMKKGALDYSLAFSIMKQAGLAVGAAGEIGLIHRDIKPENLLLTKKGQVKVADFGLCRDQDSGRVHLTQPGLTMGTPLYMSPEQAQGKPLDNRSDLYSLGVTFYHMIAGKPPFHAETALAMAMKHVHDKPPSVTVFRADVPPELDRLVLKLMAKAREERYQSAAEMLRDLSKVRDSMQTQAVGTVSLADVPTLPAASALATPAPSADARPKSKPAASTEADPEAEPAAAGTGFSAGRGLAALCVAVGLAAGSVFGWLGRSEDLLAESAVAPAVMPGLWIAPDWNRVVRRNSPEEQFRAALLLAPVESREAAWLAVPGHHPNSRDWAGRAYTQLGRVLLRRHDAARLAVLAEELDHWEGGKTHEHELAGILRAGADVLNGDIEGVVEEFTKRADPRVIIDPALVELSLEVVEQAERAVTRTGSPDRIARTRIHKLQADLLMKLY